MKVFVKYCVLLLVAVIYLGQGIDSTRYLATVTEQERLISHEKDDFERLAMLTAITGQHGSGCNKRATYFSLFAKK